MRTFGKLVLAFGLVTLLTSPVWAQGRGGFGGFGGAGGGMLLSNKGVQQEVKASDDQVQKLNALAAEVRGKQQGLREKLQDVPQDQRREKMQELARPINEEMNKDLAEILKPDQLRRFHQIQTQVAGVNAFAMPRVDHALKLTDDQKSKVREITEELATSTREAFQGAQDNREAAMKKVAELHKAANEKATALLSADQKKAWKDLTGETFEVKFERPAN